MGKAASKAVAGPHPPHCFPQSHGRPVYHFHMVPRLVLLQVSPPLPQQHALNETSPASRREQSGHRSRSTLSKGFNDLLLKHKCVSRQGFAMTRAVRGYSNQVEQGMLEKSSKETSFGEQNISEPQTHQLLPLLPSCLQSRAGEAKMLHL